jgi:glycosyltransferase involved in cell wall biosynthesis
MPAFDIVAVPSHVEPLGLTALEGMAASRPVVGSRVGGIAETVLDGETGLLVPARDSASLAAAIEWLADRPEARAAFGARGRQRVIDRFSIAAHVSAVQAVYDEMLGAVPAAGHRAAAS